MFKFAFTPKKILIVALPLLAQAAIQPLAQADHFASSRTVGRAGQPLNVELVVDQQRGDAVYVAAEINGAFWFLNRQGQFQPYQPGQVTPPALHAPAPGRHTLLNMGVPADLAGKVKLYTMRGPGDTDIIAAALNGAADVTTLNYSRYSFNEASQDSHDYNGDGFPDDDGNGDGIGDGEEFTDTDHNGIDDDQEQNGTDPNGNCPPGSKYEHGFCQVDGNEDDD